MGPLLTKLIECRDAVEMSVNTECQKVIISMDESSRLRQELGRMKEQSRSLFADD